MSILPSGIWTQDTADATHQSSPNLAKFLIGFLPKEKHVFDFGCGNGYYISELAKHGFSCTGVEGFKLNNSLHPNIILHDLTQPIEWPLDSCRGGSVISLEVGEHLPQEAQQTFMRTVTNHARIIGDKLIFSWAEIGQPGLGHINCRDQKDVIDDVTSRGFKYLEDLTLAVRQNIEDNTSWFQRTLLIFERDKEING